MRSSLLDTTLGQHERRYLPTFRPAHHPGKAAATRWKPYSDRRKPTSKTTTDHSQSITPASAKSNHPGQNFPGVSFAVYDSQAYRQISNSTQAIYRLRQCRRHQSTSMEEALSRSVPIAGSSLKREFARDRSGNPLWIDTAHLMSCRPMTPS